MLGLEVLTVEWYCDISQRPRPKAAVNIAKPTPITAPWTSHALPEGTSRIRIAPSGIIAAQATEAKMPCASSTRCANAGSAGPASAILSMKNVCRSIFHTATSRGYGEIYHKVRMPSISKALYRGFQHIARQTIDGSSLLITPSNGATMIRAFLFRLMRAEFSSNVSRTFTQISNTRLGAVVIELTEVFCAGERS